MNAKRSVCMPVLITWKAVDLELIAISTTKVIFLIHLMTCSHLHKLYSIKVIHLEGSESKQC
jgi:hypothetical protein